MRTLGPGPNDQRQATCLNRIIRWFEDGLEYEANLRQAEKLIGELKLAGEGVIAVSAPGVKYSQSMIDDAVLLAIDRHTHFWGIASRANYLSADRPDYQLDAGGWPHRQSWP